MYLELVFVGKWNKYLNEVDEECRGGDCAERNYFYIILMKYKSNKCKI